MRRVSPSPVARDLGIQPGSWATGPLRIGSAREDRGAAYTVLRLTGEPRFGSPVGSTVDLTVQYIHGRDCKNDEVDP